MSLSTPMDDDAELIERYGAVSPRRACTLLGVGNTRLYELMNSGELESYREGKSRRITLRSILARRNRLMAEADRRRAEAAAGA
jgi:excisionase family DNA binding protein